MQINKINKNDRFKNVNGYVYTVYGVLNDGLDDILYLLYDTNSQTQGEYKATTKANFERMIQRGQLIKQ